LSIDAVVLGTGGTRPNFTVIHIFAEDRYTSTAIPGCCIFLCKWRLYHHPQLLHRGAGRFGPLGPTSLRSSRYTFRTYRDGGSAWLGIVRSGVSPNSPSSSTEITL
jgi:hypothetical protein